MSKFWMMEKWNCRDQGVSWTEIEGETPMAAMREHFIGEALENDDMEEDIPMGDRRRSQEMEWADGSGWGPHGEYEGVAYLLQEESEWFVGVTRKDCAYASVMVPNLPE